MIKPSQKHTTLGLSALLILIVIFGGVLIFYIRKQPDSSKSTAKVAGTNIDLATLNNQDFNYTVSYPTSFNVQYAQDGVDFTPKQGKGEIVLSVKGGIADVETKTDGVDPTGIQSLNSAAGIIKDSFHYVKSTPTAEASNEGRFYNVHFDPSKY